MSAEGSPPSRQNELQLARPFFSFALNLKRFFRSLSSRADRSFSEERHRSLLCLLKMGEAGLSDLSERLSISASSLCIMLGKLEEEGLVERHRSKQDRRQVRYSCTEKGRERLMAAEHAALEHLARHLERLSDEDKKRLLTAMSEMEAVLSSLSETSFEQ
ncbi:MAG: MarR family winged helix-turn-helix transcriptional regulator [Treponema sp.]|nr:MarR family winged helix-turn-helix transcriptional regulator [Treponema sp.]